MKRLLSTARILFLSYITLAASSTMAALPSAPELVKVSWIENRSEFLVRWSAVPGANFYNVYRLDTNTTEWVRIATDLSVLSVPMFRDPAAPDPGPVSYAVSALNVEGEGATTAASLTPTPYQGFYISLNNPDYWATGFTFGDPEFSSSLIAGTDGMVEVGIDFTNFTHAAWNTNIYGFHRFHITNLPSGFRYYVQVTAVDELGSGITVIAPYSSFVCPPWPTFNATEDTPSDPMQLASWSAPNVQIHTPPANGTVELHSYLSQHWTYTPNANFTGTDTFQILDNPSGPPVTVTINVINVNDPPQATAFTVYVPEDANTLITPLVVDLENNPYNVYAWSMPPNGTVLGQNISLLYIPNPDFVGTEEFDFFAIDNDWGPFARGIIIVTNINDQPLAFPQDIYTFEDTATNITLAAFDVDGDALVFEIVDLPTGGTLTGDAPNLTYTPAADFYGPDSFTFRVSDGQVSSSLATVNLLIEAVNDAPTAQGQSVSTSEDNSVAVTLVGNDPDGNSVDFIITSAPTHGTLSGSGPDLIYTPTADYGGTDAFTFKTSDGSLDSAPATVSITISAVNDAPSADNKSVTTAEDQASAITLSGSDAEGSNLTFSIVTPPEHGAFADGTYTPGSNYFGTDSFSYKANDGDLDSAVATVTITVTPVNDAPTADNKASSTSEDQPVSIALTGGDAEGTTLTFTIVTAPQHGTFANGVYTPAGNYFGADSFTYKASDGQLDSALATVNITISSVNDAPVANAQSISTGYNTGVNITLSGSDVEGSALAFSIVSGPANGTLTGSGANRTFTPNPGFAGVTTLTFVANDGALDSTPATVSITVAAPTSVPAAPTGLSLVAASSSQINLTWTDNSSNEDGFKIERSLNGSAWTQIATVGINVRTYSSTGLNANTRYYYRVRGYNALGNSPYSNTPNIKTLR